MSHSANKSYLRLIFILSFYLNVLKVECNIQNSENNPNIWRQAGRITGILLQGCKELTLKNATSEYDFNSSDFLRCIKKRSLRALDRYLDGTEVIQITQGLNLVKDKESNETAQSRQIHENRMAKSGRSLNMIEELLERMYYVFDDYSLQIDLPQQQIDKDAKGVKGRRRHHHRNNMMTSLMMFGIVAVGMIMIPMGFQFLAVLGGKALLLAKMALLLTSIQGLKKIATSNVNYGLYSTSGGGGPWHYDRQWKNDDASSTWNTNNAYDSGYDQPSADLHPPIDIIRKRLYIDNY